MAEFTFKDKTTGAVYEFSGPDETTDDEAWKVLQQRLASSPTAAGAPFAVRMKVGAAETRKDKLATLQEIYPSATHYGKDNFVYFDDDGQRRLFNEEGLDLGDIAEYGPEIAELAGGTVGGIAGAIAGAPAGGVGSIPTAALGAGAGANAAKELYRYGLGALDTRSVPERFVDQGKTVLWNAVGEGAGRLGADVVGDIVRAQMVAPEAAGRIREFKSFGIDPSGAAGEIADTRLTRVASKVLQGLPSSVTTMDTARNATLDSYAAAVMRDVMGEGVAPSGANAAIREGVDRFGRETGQRLRENNAALRNELGSMPVVIDDLPTVSGVRDTMRADIERAGANRYLGKGLSEADELLSGRFAEGAVTPFGDMLNAKTDLFGKLDRPDVSQYVGKEAQGVRQVYDALNRDMRTLAEGTPGADLWRAADQAVIDYRATPGPTGKTNAEIVKAVDRKDTDQLARWALAGGKEGSGRIAQLRGMMSQDEWSTFARNVLAGWGQSSKTGDFSVDQFVTRWNSFDEAAKRQLFGDDYTRLTRLARLGESLKATEAVANTSNTATHGFFAQLLQGSVGGGAGSLTGDPLTGAALSIVAPWAAAKGLTAPGFMDFAVSQGSGPVSQAVAGTLGRYGILDY